MLYCLDFLMFNWWLKFNTTLEFTSQLLLVYLFMNRLIGVFTLFYDSFLCYGTYKLSIHNITPYEI